MDWIAYAFIATFSFAMMTLITKKLGLIGIDERMMLFYLFLIATILFFILVKLQNLSFSLTNTKFILIFAAAVLSVVGNIYAFKSIFTAPNPGYYNAIQASSILIVILASVLLFKSEFTLIKGLGSVLVIMGVALLAL